MNKLKFLLAALLLFNTAYAAEPYITSNNILYGDYVYMKVPFEYEDVYAADMLVTYSDNLEFKNAECGTDGETAVYEDGKSVRFAFLPEEKPTEITFSFKALKSGEAFVDLKEITIVSDALEETVTAPETKTVFTIKSDAPSYGGDGGSSSGGSSGGGSKGSGSSSVFIPPTPVTVPEKIAVQMPFGDVVSNYWARDYISDLYEKGIISDAAYFRPEDCITRAEFVKLAVAAFNITSEENIAGFSDVSESDWFFPYISAAADNGIVTGDNSYFYPEDNITREDICVILHRIVKHTAEKSTEFADMRDISDYAYDAVMSLADLGVVNGNENGEFQPKLFATRAQAAKMISAAKSANDTNAAEQQ